MSVGDQETQERAFTFPDTYSGAVSVEDLDDASYVGWGTRICQGVWL